MNPHPHIEQLPPLYEECYMVYPDQDSLGFILALADPGEDGQVAIASHFPKLKLALDLDQLASFQEVARNVPMFPTGPQWFSEHHHWLMVAIKDDAPQAKFLVRAKSLAKAIRKAAEAAPGCKFNIVGELKQFELAASTLMDVINARASLPKLDLRSPGAGQ